MSADADFIIRRLRTASEWFDEEGQQVLASDMHQACQAVAALAAERDRLKAALLHLSQPNWSVRSTGADARAMADFARAALGEQT